MNTEHQLKSKLAWPVYPTSTKLINKNGTGAMITAKNDVFIGLYITEKLIFNRGIDF